MHVPEGRKRRRSTAIAGTISPRRVSKEQSPDETLTGSAKGASENRHWSERRFRAVFDAALDAIVILDDDRRFIEVNPAACALFGLPEEELIGRTVAEITAPGFDAGERWRLFRERGVLEGDWSIVLPGGATRNVEYSARASFLPGQHLAMLRDITDRKRLERELMTSKVHLVEGQKLSNTGSWTWHVATGELVWSHQTFRIFGLDAGSAKPSIPLFLQRVHPDDRAAVEVEMERAQREQTYFDLGFRMLQPAGAVRHVQSLGRPVFDKSGSLEQFLGAVTDVTAFRLSEQRLQQSYGELQALTERLRTVREEEGARIAREVHDEVGQTLTALQMDVAWMQRRVAEAPITDAEPLTAKLQSMDGLLEKMIDTVQRIATELRPGVLDELGLEAAIVWYAAEFEKRSGLACQVRSELGTVPIPAVRATAVFRIVQEALTNVARHAGATRAEVALSAAEHCLRLEIRDNGRGIPRNRIADARSLGLLGMRERARALGGEVTIHGSASRGTAVSLTLPL